MLQRDIWKSLVEWKNRSHHPLIISGLRQVGKTYIAKEFGREFYENVVYLDLRSNTTIHSAFSGNFDVDTMVLAITANDPSAHFVPGKTLVILDEIQDCPNARSSLKYWDLDKRYDVIATGSFLGVKGFRTPYQRGIPVGYEEEMTMMPLSFHEFIVNYGMKDDVIRYVRQCLKDHKQIMPAVHASFRSLYYQYLIVGGMPEVVNVFLTNKDVNHVQNLQRQILRSIRDDFGRYKDADGNDRINETLKLRAEACLDSVPSQLSREYKKFKYSEVDVSGHSTDKADGVQYICDVGLVMKAYNLKEISSPLEAQKLSEEFKLYYADTGLLISQLDEGTAVNVLKGDLSAYKGAIAENAVACALRTAGKNLYYYHHRSGSPELDFIAEKDGEAVMIECKSSRTKATSMSYVLKHPQKFGKHPAIKYADTNVGGGDGFETYPLYAIALLEIKKENLQFPKLQTDFNLQ